MSRQSKSPNSSEKKKSATSNGIGHFSPQTAENTFSFSPDKDKDPAMKLADILMEKPRTSEQKPKLKHTLTSLYDRAKEIAANKEKKVNAIFQEICPFRPKLNELSMKMISVAKREGKDLRHSKKAEQSKPQPSPDEEIPKNSSGLLQDFLDRNYTIAMAKAEEKKEPLFIPLLDRIDEECTFKPLLDVKSVELAKKNKIGVYEKAKRSFEEKKSLLEKAKSQKEEEEMKACTFTPKIIKSFIPNRRSDVRAISASRGYSGRSKSIGRSPMRNSIFEYYEDY